MASVCMNTHNLSGFHMHERLSGALREMTVRLFVNIHTARMTAKWWHGCHSYRNNDCWPVYHNVYKWNSSENSIQTEIYISIGVTFWVRINASYHFEQKWMHPIVWTPYKPISAISTAHNYGENDHYHLMQLMHNSAPIAIYYFIFDIDGLAWATWECKMYGIVSGRAIRQQQRLL